MTCIAVLRPDSGRRRITAWRPDPADPKRRLYELACGHTVSRRVGGGNTKVCGYCCKET